MNFEGKIIIPAEHDWSTGFSEGLVSLRKSGKDEKYGAFDVNGNVIIPFEYEDVLFFKGGLAEVKKDGKYGVIDKDNKVVIPIIYDKFEATYRGLFGARKDGEYFLLNHRNQELP